MVKVIVRSPGPKDLRIGAQERSSACKRTQIVNQTPGKGVNRGGEISELSRFYHALADLSVTSAIRLRIM